MPFFAAHLAAKKQPPRKAIPATHALLAPQRAARTQDCRAAALSSNAPRAPNARPGAGRGRAAADPRQTRRPERGVVVVFTHTPPSPPPSPPPATFLAAPRGALVPLPPHPLSPGPFLLTRNRAGRRFFGFFSGGLGVGARRGGGVLSLSKPPTARAARPPPLPADPFLHNNTTHQTNPGPPKQQQQPHTTRPPPLPPFLRRAPPPPSPRTAETGRRFPDYHPPAQQPNRFPLIRVCSPAHFSSRLVPPSPPERREKEAKAARGRGRFCRFLLLSPPPQNRSDPRVLT